MQLIASKRFFFGGRPLKPGDAFDAEKKHARALVAIRKARYASSEPAPVKAPARRTGYARRDMVAQPPGDSSAVGAIPAPKRKYTPRKPKVSE